ncbi:MAG: ATPase [Clostridiaceae bacterium]|nr:ATPase [Clostridiaceae bacterium]
MPKTGSIRHIFAGGNTTRGFYSYYQYILSQEEANRIICIKGGPGVGKSTFMKKIGDEMIKKGYDLEYIHCSSDNNSLDGVVIPALKVALIDGTAPHVVDPKNPGAVDEILHLGDFWNEEGLRKNKKQILQSNATIKGLFARAYRYLAAAKSIYDDISAVYEEATNRAGVNREAEEIVSGLFKNVPLSDKLGRVRKLFGSAITPGGLCNYLETIIDVNERVYVVKGAVGTGTERLLAKIADAAVQRGLDVETYYCPMDPEKRIEHVIIPGLSLAFTTSNKYHAAGNNSKNIIDLGIYTDKSILEKHGEILKYDNDMLDSLLDRAILTIKKAKEEHDRMESYYIPNMNFDEVQACLEKTLNRIFKYADG